MMVNPSQCSEPSRQLEICSIIPVQAALQSLCYLNLSPSFPEHLKCQRAQPAMRGIAVEALVPVLRDLDAWQCERCLERDQAEWSGDTCGEVRGQGGNTVGLRG